jgi:hypothetical protein
MAADFTVVAALAGGGSMGMETKRVALSARSDRMLVSVAVAAALAFPLFTAWMAVLLFGLV